MGNNSFQPNKYQFNTFYGQKGGLVNQYDYNIEAGGGGGGGHGTTTTGINS